jgi:hypothetical protein
MVKTNQIKKDILKVTLLLLAFNGLMNTTYSQKYRSYENREQYFGYINFRRTHVTLPDTVLKLSYRELNTDKESVIQGMFFNEKQKRKVLSDSLQQGLFSFKKNEWIGMQKVPASFVNLLCDNGMVNIAQDYQTDYWEPMFDIQGDTMIKDFKEWNDFWFLGKISINPKFYSYLIFTHEKDTSGWVRVRSLFVMNVKDNRITSLTQVAYVAAFEGEGPYHFSKASSRGRYCYYGFYHSSNLFVNRFGRYYNVPKEEKYTYYAFDENGYVQIQELKGRKKFIIYKHKHILFENIR